MKKKKLVTVLVVVVLFSIVTPLLTSCEVFKKKVTVTYTHDWVLDWSSDMEYHWHKCRNCSAVVCKEKHTFENGVCVCGKAEECKKNKTK